MLRLSIDNCTPRPPRNTQNSSTPYLTHPPYRTHPPYSAQTGCPHLASCRTQMEMATYVILDTFTAIAFVTPLASTVRLLQPRFGPLGSARDE